MKTNKIMTNEKDMQLLNAECDMIAKKLGFKVGVRPAECRVFYDYKQKNAKGERLTVELAYCDGVSLPKRWHKAGCTKELITEWWGVDTYVYDKQGNCFKAYDPTIKKSEDGKRYEIDFDWHLKATASNFKKILEEIVKQFNA